MLVTTIFVFSNIFSFNKIFFLNFALIFFLNFRRACTHDPHWLHVRGRAAADPVRGGGRHSDRARQLRPLQHRHLQRRRQDPLERQLYVAQDKTHPSEQVSIFFSLQHKLKSKCCMIIMKSVTRCQTWVNNIQKHPLDHLWLSSCCHLLYNYKGETKVAIICALLLTSPGEMWTVVSWGGTISVTLDTLLQLQSHQHKQNWDPGAEESIQCQHGEGRAWTLSPEAIGREINQCWM